MASSFRYLGTVTTTLGICIALAAPVQAQTDDSADIIVTARRSEERLQDVPISITVYNQEQLTNRNVVNSEDLARYTPSLTSNNNFGSLNSTFAIRGFVQDISTQPSVGVYFGDVVAPRGAASNIPVGDGAGPGNFFDLANVQVLKGPQGTLFGRNTTGGAVLLVPQKPTDILEGYVEGSIGNYDMRRVQAVVNLPVLDTLRVRLGVDRQKRDGYLINTSVTSPTDFTRIGPRDFADVDYIAIRASIVADLTPDLENYTIISYGRSDTNGDVQKVIACDPVANPLFGPAACDQLAREQARGASFYNVQNDFANANALQEQWQIINTTTWQATDTLTVKNIASYAELKQRVTADLFGSNFFLPGTSIPFTPFNITAAPGLDSASQFTFTNEFQLQGQTDRLNWQAGAYLEISDPLGQSGTLSPILLSCSDYGTFQCTDPTGFGTFNYSLSRTFFRNIGLYAQATYRLNEKLAVTGGLRYTWDRARYEGELKRFGVPFPPDPASIACTAADNPDAVAPECAVKYVARSDKPTWLLDVEYKPAEDILLYAKYVRGYRAGGIAPPSPADYAVFRPEKVDTYEGGFKASFRGAVRGTLNAAVFYNDFSDQQLQLSLDPRIVGVSQASGIFNAGRSRIYGAEVEASLTPFAGFTIEGSYAYINAKIRQIDPITTGPDALYDVISHLFAGDPLTLTPRNKYTITGSYTLPLDEAWGQITLGAAFTHTDSQLANYAARESTLPGAASLAILAPRDILDASINWTGIAGSPVDLGLFATNITKERYYNFTPGLITTVGFDTAVLGQPRMYGVRLRYNFGR